ncbi:MAG: response regulator transcription factor [Pseudomonadota bacterium]
MTSPRRILLAVDDPALGDTLGEHLAAAGHLVTAWPAPGPADLVIVDDRHPEAASLCGGARSRADGPVVLVVGSPLPGADAVFERPLRLRTLMAKVAELTRDRTGIHLGPWRLDAGGRLLVGNDGTKVRLTDKEAAILTFLAAAGGTVARETLLAEVWGYSSAVTTHTLETHIYRLRRKLERDPARAEILITEDGGYRLVMN